MPKNKTAPSVEHLKNSSHLAHMQRAIVKVMRAFNQEYQEFHQNLSNYFINQLMQKHGRNISQIRAHTGFSDALVKKGLNQKLAQTSSFIEQQMSLLSSAFTEINSYCHHHHTERMPKLEFYRCMQSYADGHISVRSRLDRLMETGLINEDEQGVFLVFDKPVQTISNDEHLKFISQGFNHLASTVIYNKNKPDHLPKLFQRRIRSTQIPPKKSLKIQNKINDILAVSLEQVNDLLTEHEEDVANGRYPEIVVHFLQYNQNLTEEYNHEKT